MLLKAWSRTVVSGISLGSGVRVLVIYQRLWKVFGYCFYGGQISAELFQGVIRVTYFTGHHRQIQVDVDAEAENPHGGGGG